MITKNLSYSITACTLIALTGPLTLVSMPPKLSLHHEKFDSDMLKQVKNKIHPKHKEYFDFVAKNNLVAKNEPIKKTHVDYDSDNESDSDNVSEESYDSDNVSEGSTDQKKVSLVEIITSQAIAGVLNVTSHLSDMAASSMSNVTSGVSHMAARLPNIPTFEGPDVIGLASAGKDLGEGVKKIAEAIKETKHTFEIKKTNHTFIIKELPEIGLKKDTLDTLNVTTGYLKDIALAGERTVASFSEQVQDLTALTLSGYITYKTFDRITQQNSSNSYGTVACGALGVATILGLRNYLRASR